MLKDVKKITSVLIFSFLIVSSINQANAIDIYYKNHLLRTDVKPLIENGRTLVPISVIAYNMGADIKWNSNKKLVTIIKQNTKIHIEIGSLNILVETNQKKQIKKLDVPAMIVHDRTMVPIRAISEIFGSDVKWDKYTNSILIDSDKKITFKDSTNVKPEYSSSTSISKSMENIIIKNLENLPRGNYKFPDLKVKIEDVSSNQRYINQITLLKKKLSGTYKAFNVSSIKNPHYSLICYVNIKDSLVYVQEKSNDNKRELGIYSLPDYSIITSPDFDYEFENIIRSILMKNKRISKDDDLLIEQKYVTTNNSYAVQHLKVTMEDGIGSHHMGDYLVDVYNKTIIDSKSKKIIYADPKK